MLVQVKVIFSSKTPWNPIFYNNLVICHLYFFNWILLDWSILYFIGIFLNPFKFWNTLFPTLMFSHVLGHKSRVNPKLKLINRTTLESPRKVNKGPNKCIFNRQMIVTVQGFKDTKWLVLPISFFFLITWKIVDRRYYFSDTKILITQSHTKNDSDS